MRFFLWEKTTNKGYILQRGTIWGGVPKKWKKVHENLQIKLTV